MTTIATLLSGGEGVGVGAKAAGLDHLWGIEIDDKIAQIARTNAFHTITADIRDVDPHTLEIPDVLHASPECQNASSAKQVRGAKTFEEKEAPLDMAIAHAILRYVEILRPRFFTLENVYGYRRFKSFEMILRALSHMDYFTDFGNLNAADFAVPQTRRRLILRAARGGLVPMLPLPEPWVGWYEAIEDLIPTLPESAFAAWQLKRLQLADSTLVDSAGYVDIDGRLPVQRDASEPANTIIANHARRPMRAFLMMTNATSSHPETRGTGILAPGQPANTVCAGVARGRAFIIDGQNAGREKPTVRQADEPTMTVTDASKAFPGAFIVGGQFGKPDDGSGEPRPPQTRGGGEPVFTVTAQNKGDWRAWLSRGRVVKMTPRALARFQSFPDDYILPDGQGLACRIIGNAVPPLMYQKIVAGLVE